MELLGIGLILEPGSVQTIIKPFDVDVGESPARLAFGAMPLFHALVGEGNESLIGRGYVGEKVNLVFNFHGLGWAGNLRLYHIVHVGGTAERANRSILDSLAFSIGSQGVVQLGPMKRNRFRGWRGQVEAGFEHTRTVFGPEMIKITEVVAIFNQSAVLPAAAEVN
jgi:hypothetical protein